ncbi:DUF2249 domain-containing protein [Haladaptatus sp. NG-WS-4]
MATPDADSRWLRPFGDEIPSHRPHELLDVRTMGPPHPLKATLETLTELEENVVLVQLNDRPPQHLYPKLGDRGYEHATLELDDAVVTAIWNPGVRE